jgi:hypothetical protein
MDSDSAGTGEPTPLATHLASLDAASLRAEFQANDEFIVIPGVLPPDLLNLLLAALPTLESRVHRNFIPGHKKGGSISRFDLDQHAPVFAALYRAPELASFMHTLCERDLLFCPDDDPHTYALYYYTEPGDHIGFHYDTSYYRGQRYTVLLGLVDESSCRLEYELFRENCTRDAVRGEVSLSPGTFVFFNGDKLYHRISPCGPGERRVALTFEYVTDPSMHPLRRFVSNMKDSIAYFGFRQVFTGPSRR